MIASDSVHFIHLQILAVAVNYFCLVLKRIAAYFISQLAGN